jgi:hypothetical protein
MKHVLLWALVFSLLGMACGCDTMSSEQEADSMSREQ